MLKKEVFFLLAYLILIFSILMIIQGLLYLKGFYALSADEAGHTLEGYYWYNGTSSFFSIWLPFQKILYGFSFYFWNNLFWTPRIISSIFGLLTLLSVMFLTFHLFNNHIVTILAGFLGSIHWGIVIFSVLPMTEIYFTFFIIAALGFLVKWLCDKKNTSILLSLMFCSIGNTVRFESWIFSLIICLVIVHNIFISRRVTLVRFWNLILFLFILFLFPIIWVALSYNETGSITGFINLVINRYTPGDIFSRINNSMLFNFFKINLLTLNILGLIIFFLFRRNREVNSYFIVFIFTLIIIGVLTFTSNAMPTHNPWRLATIWSILLIPLNVYLIYFLWISKTPMLKLCSILFLFLQLLFSYLQILKYSELSYLTKEDLFLGSYVADSLLLNNSASKIFIEKNNWEYTNLLISTGMPEKFVTDDMLFNDFQIKSVPYFNSTNTKFKDNNIKYIILKPYNEDCFSLSNLIVLRRYKKWVVYKFK